MLIIDEYLAVRVLGGNWPDGAPATTSPSQRRGTGGYCSASTPPAGGNCPASSTSSAPPDARACATLTPKCSRSSTPRPLLDEAASIAARYGAGGLLIAESLRALARIADDLRIEVRVTEPA